MSEEWYREFNSVFFLTLSASVFAFFGLCLQAILKSRCKTCKFSCIEIERDVEPPGKDPHLDISVLDRGRASSIDHHPPPTPPTPPNKNNQV